MYSTYMCVYCLTCIPIPHVSRYGRRSNWFKIHCLMQQNLGSKSAHSGGSSTPPAGHPPAEHSLRPTISGPPPPGLLSPLKLETGGPGRAGGSRTPSPLHLSLSTSSSHQSSQSPLGPPETLSPPPSLLPQMTEGSRRDGDFACHPLLPSAAVSMPALYGFPPPLPFLSVPPSQLALPFYRLSPLLASNPFLANSILFSLAGQKHQADLFKVR